MVPILDQPQGRPIPAKHLKTFSGVLQADAFAGCTLYAEDRERCPILEAGCWSHAWCKVWDIQVRQHKLTGTAGAPGAAAHE